MSLTKMKTGKILGVTFLICIVVIMCMVVIYPSFNNFYNGVKTNNSILNGGPTATPSTLGNTFAGPVQVNLPFYVFNNTATTSSASAILLHADHSIIGAGTPGTAGKVTGSLSASDNGMAYLLVNANGNTTFGLLYNMIATSNPGVVVGNPSLYLYQGSYYVQYQLNLAGLSMSGGLTAGTTTLNVYGFQTITPTLVSLLNSTAATANAPMNIQTVSNFAGFQTSPWGQGTKILRMQITASNSTDASAMEQQALVPTSVTINFGNGVIQTYNNFKSQLGTGGQNSTDYIEVIGGPGQSYLCGNSINNEFYGIPLVCGQADASSTLTVTINWQAQMSTAGTYLPLLTFTYIGPTGTTSTFSHNVSIT